MATAVLWEQGCLGRESGTEKSFSGVDTEADWTATSVCLSVAQPVTSC